MVVILKQKAKQEEIERLTKQLEAKGVSVSLVVGSDVSILGLVGDTSAIDPSVVAANGIVERVMKVQEPFKKANRMFHPEDTIVDVNGAKIGERK